MIDRIDIDETVSATIATITFQAESVCRGTAFAEIADTDWALQSALAVLKVRNNILINGTRFLVESASKPVVEEVSAACSTTRGAEDVTQIGLMCEYRPKTTSHLQEAVSAVRALIEELG